MKGFNDAQARCDLVLGHYLGESISLGRAAELLKIPWPDLRARFLRHAPTDATRLGSAIHAALLESDRFDEKYILTPIRGKGLLDYKIELQQEGYVMCSQKMLDIARCARENAHNHPLFAKLLAGIKREHVEQSFFFEWGMMRDEFHQWVGKMRPDLCRDDIGMWVDIKSTRKIDPYGWCAESAKYGYDVTKAWYQFGIDICQNQGWIKPIDTYLFAVVENDFPCRVEVYEMGGATTQLGKDRMAAAISRIADCLIAGDWPSERNTDVRPFEHPDYVFTAWGEYLQHQEEEQ